MMFVTENPIRSSTLSLLPEKWDFVGMAVDVGIGVDRLPLDLFELSTYLCALPRFGVFVGNDPSGGRMLLRTKC